MVKSTGLGRSDQGVEVIGTQNSFLSVRNRVR